jgi:glutamate transport system permease protein
MTTTTLYDVPGPRALRRERVISRITAVLLIVLIAAGAYRLYRTGQFQSAYWRPFLDIDILRGIGIATVATLRASALGISFALILAIVLSFARLSSHPAVRKPAIAFIDFFRAVPVLLLLLFIFLGFSRQIGQLGALVLALALFNGAVLAEIIAAGIRALPKGQSDAALALGLSRAQTFRLILLPQAVRTMLPAIVSQCVVALKDTALGFVIAYEELVRTAQLIYNGYGNILPTVFVVGTIYVSINLVIASAATMLERRQSRTPSGKRSM